MVVQIATDPMIYTLTLSPVECEQLLVALEYAIASRHGEPERAILLRELDAEQLDALADRVLLAAPIA